MDPFFIGKAHALWYNGGLNIENATQIHQALHRPIQRCICTFALHKQKLLDFPGRWILWRCHSYRSFPGWRLWYADLHCRSHRRGFLRCPRRIESWMQKATGSEDGWDPATLRWVYSLPKANDGNGLKIIPVVEPVQKWTGSIFLLEQQIDWFCICVIYNKSTNKGVFWEEFSQQTIRQTWIWRRSVVLWKTKNFGGVYWLLE